MTYEYKILAAKAPTASEGQLNDFGQKGWRLQAVLNWGGQWYYYLMRETREEVN